MSDREEQNVKMDEMSLDELLDTTKEDIARVDSMMGAGDEAENRMDADTILAESRAEKKQMPAFEPELPKEYRDLKLDSEEKAAKDGEEEPERTGLPAWAKVLLYVCCVLAASVLLAVGAWLCADDVLALTKPDEVITVTVPENASIADVTREMKDKGLIRYEWLFKFYCWYSHAEQKIVPGTYELNNMYDYHALINGMIKTSGNRATATVMIPEGYECKDIFRLLEEKEICSVRDLEAAAASHDFEYDFLKDLPYGDRNRLEGYLFPDTYEFYLNDDAENVIDKFLRNFKAKMNEELLASIDDLNERLEKKMAANGFTQAEISNVEMSLHDVIIVASLVEKETARAAESANIAAVIYNRLCSKLYPCLQLDSTIQYVLAERKEVLTNADKGILSPYNTYKNPGLPVGPISNPGMSSIRAALYPAEAEYYFYALNADGVHHFSETYYEHQDFLNEMAGIGDAAESEEQDAEETETENETNAPET